MHILHKITKFLSAHLFTNVHFERFYAFFEPNPTSGMLHLPNHSPVSESDHSLHDMYLVYLCSVASYASDWA